MILQIWAHTRVSLRCTCVTVCSIRSTCVGNNPQSVCFSWLSEQEGETPASVFVCVCKPVCVCMWRTLRWLLFSCQPSGCSLCPLLLFIWLNYAYVFASVCVSVCSTAFQVPAASSSAVTGSNGPHTHTFFLSLKILLVSTLRCPDATMAKK